MAPSIPALIEKKRDGLTLTDAEIQQFVLAVVDRSMQDSQIGAMLMAIYLQGMTASETVELTRAMTHSGQLLSFPARWQDLLVDKHSTGGVGDKISLVLAPTLAALGFKVPMVSGRGLGFTGGTLDKLESIPGFKTKLTNDEMEACLEVAGCFIASATGALAPADAILYQQRDVTSTVGCLPLIVSSILSKKIAEGTKTLVMDVKVGRGTFIKTQEAAREIAAMLVDISAGLGVDTHVVLSNMDSPIGEAVGNAVEVAEAIESLRGSGPKDVLQLVSVLGGVILHAKGRVKDLGEGCSIVAKVVQDGDALKYFQKMIIQQGVNEETADELCFGDTTKVLPQSAYSTTLHVKTSGYVRDLDALVVGLVCWKLGAGRSNASDPVDHSVGLRLLATPFDRLEAGAPWVQVLHSTEQLPDDLRLQLESALTMADQPGECLPLLSVFK